MKNIAALISGLLFGVGLAVAQMTNPTKVISFLDVTGNWDPSLALVMGAAFFVALLGFKLTAQRAGPLFDEKFRLPTRTDLDKPLVLGAALFGAGWGLAGYCPGPVIASLGLLNFDSLAGSLTGPLLTNAEPLVFLISMLVGAAFQGKLAAK